jgi:hypothetical protein
VEKLNQGVILQKGVKKLWVGGAPNGSIGLPEPHLFFGGFTYNNGDFLLQVQEQAYNWKHERKQVTPLIKSGTWFIKGIWNLDKKQKLLWQRTKRFLKKHFG